MILIKEKKDPFQKYKDTKTNKRGWPARKVKREKLMSASETFKKTKKSGKKQRAKKQMPINDSPFSMLKVLIKN